MSLHRLTKKSLRRLGFDLCRYQPKSHPVAKRMELVRRLDVDLVLDVGANIGQFGRDLRDLGYRGRIVSFEPLNDVFARLSERAAQDANWQAYNFALGDQDSDSQINVSADTWSSSLREATDTIRSAVPQEYQVRRQPTQVKKLDSILQDLAPQASRIWLKVDTQGYEMQVLGGAIDSLSKVVLMQLEMCFAPLYEGQTLFGPLCAWLEERGYRLGSLENMAWHPSSGELLWLDGLFHKATLTA